jgi:hypothetical protein
MGHCIILPPSWYSVLASREALEAVYLHAYFVSLGLYPNLRRCYGKK